MPIDTSFIEVLGRITGQGKYIAINVDASGNFTLGNSTTTKSQLTPVLAKVSGIGDGLLFTCDINNNFSYTVTTTNPDDSSFVPVFGFSALGSSPMIIDVTLGTITNGPFSTTLTALIAASNHPVTLPRFPADSGVLNVKAFGAVGNGIIDDTSAILAAINALPVYETTFDLFTRIIYFPAGTYLVSNTLQRTLSLHRANMVFIGEAMTSTTIKLKDNCSGYGDPSNQKAIIATNSGDIFGQSPNADVYGVGNEAFNATIQELTVDCGTGNLGAIGIDWVVHNVGSIGPNVTIKTQTAALGALGIYRGYNGPGLATNITITGPFRYGILGFSNTIGMNLANQLYPNDGLMLGFEHVTITGTTVAGIINTCNNLAFRDVAITCNGGYGLDITDGSGLQLIAPMGPNEGIIVWIDGTISGTGTAPINGSGGYRNWTNVHQVNFNGTNNVDLSGVYAQATLTGTSNWQITPKNTPTPPVVTSDTWYKIAAPIWPEDAGPLIQAALNASTSPVAYLPWGYYKIEETVTIPDNIQRIEFMYANIAPTFGGSNYAFTTTLTRTADLFINNLIVSQAFGFHQQSNYRLIITNSGFGGEAVHRESSGGELYVVNVNSTHLEIDGSAGVFGRQFNPEVGSRKIFNYGTAPIWMFAMKAENASAVYESDAAANFEWVGGMQYPIGEQTDPLVVLTAGGRFSGAFAVASLSSGYKVDTVVNSLIGGITNNVPYTIFPQRGAYDGITAIALSTDNFIPVISAPNINILSSSTNGTVVETASLINYAYTGTPVWSLTNNAGGKFAINSSSGVITVAGAPLSVQDYNITVAVSGITSGASGTPGQPTPLNVVIHSVLTLVSFDPSKKSTGITLSNNNLTMAANTTNINGQSALSTTSHASGNYYITMHVDTNNGGTGTVSIGLCNASGAYAEGNYVGQDNNGISFAGSGSWYTGGAAHGGQPNWGSASSTVGMAINITAQKVWITNDGGTTWNNDVIANQNPVGNVGGISFSNVTGAIFFVGECDTNGNQLTVTTNPSSPPSGYGAW